MRMFGNGWGWVGLVAATVAISNGAVLVLLVRMPAGYFSRRHSREDNGKDRHPVLRWAILVGKNLLGVVLVLLGIVLSLPGVPGPGVVLALLGVTLVNFPGKRRLERRLIGFPGVFKAINGLRQRFGQPPLVLDGEADPPEPVGERS